MSKLNPISRLAAPFLLSAFVVAGPAVAAEDGQVVELTQTLSLIHI